MISLPKDIITILNILENNGYEGFVVGGCVRDYLMDKSPKDIDITTNGKPSALLKIFKDYKVIETGIVHGTITVIINGLPVEITTYRIDGEYSDNRRPNKVTFSQNITQDLARRDFTINAIAYHPKKGFIDPYNGRADIKSKTIKAVGNCHCRFEEDGLRILRGVRFSATLGFEIENQTKLAMEAKKNLLQNISNERIFSEFSKSILGEFFKETFEKYFSVFAVFLPKSTLSNFCSKLDFNEEAKHKLIFLKNIPAILHLKLAVFFQDEKIEITNEILKKFNCDNATIEKVKSLIKYLNDYIQLNKISIKKWLTKVSLPIFLDLLTLKKAKSESNSDELEKNHLFKIEQLTKSIIENNECYCLKQLNITGKDLLKLEFNQGKKIGEILNIILDKVIMEELENNKACLIAFAKTLK